MKFPNNQRLGSISVIGALCCWGCSLLLPSPGTPEQLRQDSSSPASADWTEIQRIQYENRRLRNRIHDSDNLPQTQTGQVTAAGLPPRPKSIAVPDEWLLKYLSNVDRVNPNFPYRLAQWRFLFNLTEEDQQQLTQVFARTLQRIRDFEAAHASTVTDANGTVSIRVKPFDPSGPARQWHFFDELRSEVAGIVGEERARFITNPLLHTTYSRHTNDALELSFIIRDGQVVLVQRTLAKENGSTTFEMPVESESAIKSVVKRYGHLLGTGSAPDLQQSLASIVNTAGGSR